VPGTWTLRARSAVNNDADTLSFTVSAGQPAGVVAATKDTALTIGKTTTLSATAADRCSNPLSAGVTFALDSGTSVAAITGDGRLTTSAFGRVRIRAQLTSGAAADTTRVSVVPDGMLAVAVGGYAIDVGIGVVNLDGSGFRLITPESNQYPFPSWSPDGTSIAYNAGPIPVGLLYRVDLNGVRTKLSMLGAMESETWPRYSSDGRFIFFTGGNYPDALDTYRMAADGSGPRVRVTPKRPGSTRYWKASPSPDGTLLAYSDAGFSLHVVSLVTGLDRQLQTGSSAESPRFSPDGAWIAIADQYGGVMKLIHPDGTGLRTIVPSAVDYWGHDWSPDGAWIVYRQSPPGLWIVRVSDGLRIPLPYSRDLYFPSWRPK
jgi:Tol biopolymer transport system component